MIVKGVGVLHIEKYNMIPLSLAVLIRDCEKIYLSRKVTKSVAVY